MEEFVEVAEAVEQFARHGHAFYPARQPGVGDVTVLYVGADTYYVVCNSKDFCKRLIRWFCMSEKLLLRFSYEILGQRKHAPFVLSAGLTLIPFWYPRYDNAAHRTAYVSMSSIQSYRFHSHDASVTLVLEDNHTLELPYSFQRLKKQLIHAEFVYYKFTARIRKEAQFSPITAEKCKN
ncbi:MULTISPECIES: competence protein ComK [Aneurinibacillus]|jgi:hypothetical protein|uniref:ComK protein n=1 Tax=Aneurinibacillus thermoaerophilus TaxID=143495 RepID=A0A1G8DKY0_ANETH|nr:MULTISPECIES: competence protein ComK [Aneurinibacillus]AMA71710.1 hypothetical protein ACH33_01875 [Aneurinibacillus sp. XH2]MED0738677.1 competence protein ComK [Aneurinibacillus thermoaerophilus]MED0757794.1 competence protein ComK [Aneurinibacillus thermoaerophilus]MED0761522.1 competence protein ComK [Aneurinibacillus thermoaerophilus]QYY42536.1 competence protein ComK [Aneurinibacillus thermoaerophilus]